MGYGEALFRINIESIGAGKVTKDFQSVGKAAQAASSQINAASGVTEAAFTKTANVAKEKGKKVKNDMGALANDLASTGFRMTFYALSALVAGQALFQAVFIRGMAQAASQFEDAMDRVIEVSGATGSHVRQLTADILDLALTMNESAPKVADFWAEAFALGFKKEEIRSMTESFDLLAKATTQDLNVVATAGARLMSLWGQAPGQADVMAAQLLKLSQTTGRSLEKDLIPVLEEIAALIPDVAAPQIMALMSVAGRFGSEALRSLPALIQLLFRKTGGVLPENLGSALVYIAENYQSEFMQAVGGRGQAMKFLQYLKRYGAEAFEKIVAEMNELNDATRAHTFLMAEAAAELSKFQTAAKEAGKAIGNLWTTLGLGNLDFFTFAIQAVTNIVHAVQQLPTPVLMAASAFFTLTSVLVALAAFALTGIATVGLIGNKLADFVQHAQLRGYVITSWKDFAKALKVVAQQGNLGDAIIGFRVFGRLIGMALKNLMPIVGLFTVFSLITSKWASSLKDERLGALFESFRKMIDNIVGETGSLWVLGKGLSNFISLVLSPFRSILEGFGKGFMEGLVGPLWIAVYLVEKIALAFQAAANAMKTFSEVVQKSNDPFSAFLRFLGSVLDFLGSGLGRLIGWIAGFAVLVSILKGLAGNLKLIFSGMKWLGERLGPLGKSARVAGARGLVTGIPILGPLIERAWGWLKIPPGTTKEVREFLPGGGFHKGIPSAWPSPRFPQASTAERFGAALRHEATQTARTIPSMFLNAMKAMGNYLRNVFKSFAKPFRGGTDFMGMLSTTRKAMTDFFRGLLAKPSGIVSPGGEGVGGGLARSMGGIAGVLSEVKGAVRSMGGIAGVLSGIKGRITNFFRGFLNKPSGIVAPGFERVSGGLARGVGGILGLLRRIPIAAPLSVLIDLLTGVSLPQALGGGVGIGLGGLLGGALGGAAAGAIGGPLGSIIGFLIGLAGSMGGYYLGSSIGGLFGGQTEPQPLAAVTEHGGSIVFNAYITVNTQGTTREQAEEIARRTVELFHRQKEELLQEWRERNAVARTYVERR